MKFTSRVPESDETNLSSEDEVSRIFSIPTGWESLVTLVLILGLFVGDVLMPRGATVAIGYCVMPAFAAGRRSRRFLITTAVLCIVATWVAFFFEPGDYPAWKSAFDRSMVTMAVVFSLFLVLQRLANIEKLLRQRRELKESTRELERSNGELSNFTSVVAHDVRGPLNTISLFAQLLSASSCIQGDAEARESVEAIETEVARMNDFVQSLLTYGRIGSAELKRQACDCAVILDEVRRRLRADLQRSGAEVSSEPLPVIQADPTLIAELFQNLIENAIKYRRPAAPHIHLSATQESDGWLFCVRDNGRGVHPDEAQRLFAPFFQGKVERSPAKGAGGAGGVGLGLATCRRIVERHGGTIRVESSAGNGSAFFFTIAASGPSVPGAMPAFISNSRASTESHSTPID